MRVLTILFNTLNTQSMRLGRTKLIGLTGTGNFVLSQDPALLWTDINSPASDSQRSDITMVYSGLPPSLSKPVSLVDRSYFIAPAAAGTVVSLFLDP